MYEYKVVAAPRKGQKAKGAKTAEARFAVAMETMMNEMGAAGWEYVRADTLPADERAGMMSTTTVFHNVLVFKRALGAVDTAPVVAPAVVAAPVTAAVIEDEPVYEEPMIEAAPDTAPDDIVEATEAAVVDAVDRVEEAVEPARPSLFTRRNAD